MVSKDNNKVTVKFNTVYFIILLTFMITKNLSLAENSPGYT